MTSRDGYVWTEAEGLKAGVPSIGVIEPSSNLLGNALVFDVIIVGAGYCGLTAARDATLSGE
jgi:ribulose 1,5-bisphosphate synthetase/thiazole synthase